MNDELTDGERRDGIGIEYLNGCTVSSYQIAGTVSSPRFGPAVWRGVGDATKQAHAKARRRKGLRRYGGILCGVRWRFDALPAPAARQPWAALCKPFGLRLPADNSANVH
jgi:hypothetical protein